MFPTFSGSGRRPRQVNLSGRTNTNPFAKSGFPSGPQTTVINAQQNRLARQQERERAQAAASLQRTWRGYSTRKRLKLAEREEWDSTEAASVPKQNTEPPSPYNSGEEAYTSVVHLVRFLNTKDPADVDRLRHLQGRLQATIKRESNACTGGPWPKAYLRLENACLEGLERGVAPEVQHELLEAVKLAIHQSPELATGNSEKYNLGLLGALSGGSLPLEIIYGPLQAISPSIVLPYQSFARYFLTIPNLQRALGGIESLNELADKLNCKLLTGAVARFIRDKGDVAASIRSQRRSHHLRKSSKIQGTQDDPAEAYIWLLAHIIYFHRHAYHFESPERYAGGEDFIYVVATLLSAVADRLEIVPGRILKESGSSSFNADIRGVDSFVSDQIDSLINQPSIGSLISQMGLDSAGPQYSDFKGSDEHSKVLATYVLTLLRLYPNRADDLRMWLYLGSGTNSASATSSSQDQNPVIQFFWQATRSTQIYSSVLSDPRAAIQLMKPKTVVPSATSRSALKLDRQDTTEDQWRIILLFIELYMFVLKVMDDEEFFSQKNGSTISTQNRGSGRSNSLQLTEIKELSTFLKHLGFTMYYYASEILDTNVEESGRDLSSLFKIDVQESIQPDKSDKMTQVGNLTGVSLDYMKGAVTGLLRAIYERDSRRPFLPRDHWLMTSRFDMTNFIDAVVEEEERRHQVQEAEDEDGPDDESDDAWDVNRPSGYVGTNHAQRLQKIDHMRRQQRKASRRRYLQAVAPRLEILQNMPFLIPFTTRVQIFRRFVHMDQLKRRHGAVDPELWRLSQLHNANPFQHSQLERHHAKVRRQHEFEDAYDQFFDLGASLKEPIAITFVDQFDQPEAGIDGGGVTKEFLTSVTNQAFSPRDGIQLFDCTEKQLLFPNPSAIDEQKELLREAGFNDRNQMFRTQVGDLLQRYEFLGRIIGKCLYEGILVDISFAPFFLLKWALTGGTGSAPKESGYRASLNDVRDFDEALYQGLLQLKNYAGDVEDFALNFTVTDTMTLPPLLPTRSRRRATDAVHQSPKRTKTITRDLKPNGANEAVTNANRLFYISYIARHRLTQQPYQQTSAFLRGLASMIPPAWLSMFNQLELQTLVGGAPAAIDVDDLRRNTIYGGIYSIGDDGLEHPSVQLFWNVMHSLEDKDRRAVLKFVTSTPRSPLLGFGALNPRFSIRDSGRDGDDERLPSTSTCVNLLKLPRYKDRDVCRQKLLQAVNSGAGFDLS